jgi:uncharacterized SAM-binding protein YcdF (DUF218 family)
VKKAFDFIRIFLWLKWKEIRTWWLAVSILFGAMLIMCGMATLGILIADQVWFGSRLIALIKWSHTHPIADPVIDAVLILGMLFSGPIPWIYDNIKQTRKYMGSTKRK